MGPTLSVLFFSRFKMDKGAPWWLMGSTLVLGTSTHRGVLFPKPELIWGALGKSRR